MKSSKFDLSYFLNPNEKFHIARVNITSNQDLSSHSHRYAELLWIEKGSGYHHINGSKIKLTAGDMIMIRPDDTHTYSPIGKKGITLVNIAFPTETLDYFKQRYFENKCLYFWSNTYFPTHLKLSKEVVNRISARAEEAMGYTRSYMQLDSLLLFIFRQITANEKVTDLSEIPIWLFNAIQKFNNPHFFTQGVEGFVALCQRNEDYVNRVVKLHYYKTLTELINESRMKYATTQLTLTSMPIKEICNNCGFVNMGHFYKVFKNIYNQTPKEYRKLNHMIV